MSRSEQQRDGQRSPAAQLPARPRRRFVGPSRRYIFAIENEPVCVANDENHRLGGNLNNFSSAYRFLSTCEQIFTIITTR